MTKRGWLVLGILVAGLVVYGGRARVAMAAGPHVADATRLADDVLLAGSHDLAFLPFASA